MLASADVSLVTLERGTAGLAVPSKFYNILASGRPTVAVIDSFSEIARAIEEFGCGLCIEPEDAPGLAHAVAGLAEEPHEAERMGHAARQACEARYSLPHIAHRFHEIFHDVVHPAGQPQGKAGAASPESSAAPELRSKFLMRRPKDGAEPLPSVFRRK